MASVYTAKSVNGVSANSTGDVVIGSLIPNETFIVGGTGNLSYTIPAGYSLDRIVIIPVSNCSPYCSYAAGTPGDIVAADLVTSTYGANWIINIFVIVNTNIVLSSIAVGSTVVILKSKIV